jgi:hypothetical protein
MTAIIWHAYHLRTRKGRGHSPTQERDVTVHYREGNAEEHTGQLYTKRRECHRPVLGKGRHKLG